MLAYNAYQLQRSPSRPLPNYVHMHYSICDGICLVLISRGETTDIHNNFLLTSISCIPYCGKIENQIMLSLPLITSGNK